MLSAPTDPTPASASSNAIVTATRLVNSLVDVDPFFITVTEVVVWTQTAEATPSASV